MTVATLLKFVCAMFILVSKLPLPERWKKDLPVKKLTVECFNLLCFYVLLAPLSLFDLTFQIKEAKMNIIRVLHKKLDPLQILFFKLFQGTINDDVVLACRYLWPSPKRFLF